MGSAVSARAGSGLVSGIIGAVVNRTSSFLWC